ncbi:MAG: 4Fe-4S double cluster binding domain-containing protein [Bacillota bacterium]
MLTNRIKEKAYELGADMVGIVSADAIDRYAGTPVVWKNSRLKRTTDYLENARSVVVLGFGLWDDACDLTTRKGGSWVFMGEMGLSVCQRDLALFMQKERLAVYAGYPLISYKHLAQLGGLGSMGKSSLIITREFGPQVRFRCVITDALLEYDEPLAEDFCGDCNRCVEACPVGALSDYKVDSEGCMVGRHLTGKHVDPGILAEYEPNVTAHAHIMCRVCQKVCPYSKF